MGFFKEEGVDVLDLTLLKKKGILKIKEDTSPEVIDLTKIDREGFAPLVSAVSSSVSESSTSSSASAPATTFVSFWDAPVNASPASVSNFSDLSADVGSVDVKNLSVKVEDVEYKIERLSEKLLALENKIDEIVRNIR